MLQDAISHLKQELQLLERLQTLIERVPNNPVINRCVQQIGRDIVGTARALENFSEASPQVPTIIHQVFECSTQGK